MVGAESTRGAVTELLDVVHRVGLKGDQSRKLLIFTEHKDTLDLAPRIQRLQWYLKVSRYFDQRWTFDPYGPVAPLRLFEREL